MKNDVLVSICCITYNQEKYIGTALESFLKQKTNFNFEIIIHDDASNDNTQRIINEYKEKYPEIIRTIFQTENQYSKGIKIFPNVFKESKGKYIAICEGDDFWCDEKKLQKQFDFMESHKDCSLITTGANLLDDITGKTKKKKQPYKGSRYYNIDEIIMGEGDLFTTNSMFFRTNLVFNLPDFFYIPPVEDYPLTIHLSLCGKVYYNDSITSVYRVNAKGSWTQKMKAGNYLLKKEKLYNELKKMFDIINNETNSKYKQSIEYVLLRRKMELLFLSNKYGDVTNKEFKNLYKRGALINRIKNLIKIKFTIFYKLLKK